MQFLTAERGLNGNIRLLCKSKTDIPVGRVIKYERPQSKAHRFGLSLQGIYWTGEPRTPNRKGGASGASFPTLSDALLAAGAAYNLPPLESRGL